MSEWPLYTTIKWHEEETAQGTKFGYQADFVVHYTDKEIEELYPINPQEEGELKEAVHNYALTHMETLRRLGTIDLDIYRAGIYVTPRNGTLQVTPRNVEGESAKIRE